ncbi:hypothetical protein [Pandoraea commovens]|uniref:Uncharacterized protein n=1 Tax=Pandoraea commovens TaxID=2508289 RepID=A0ABY5QK14_9BURK|nr:hypothetical protein [Pandoraea commovens]UVA80488.1 hypothetical protein NTU39_05545 [Pandoraea commovens]
MKAKFYLAEDARAEVSGKLTLLGLYPNDVIVFAEGPDVTTPEGEVAKVALPKLCIVSTVSGLDDGEYELKASLYSANGKEAMPPSTVISKFKASPDVEGHTSIMQLAPFVAEAMGKCKFVLEVGPHTVTYEFELRVGRVTV